MSIYLGKNVKLMREDRIVGWECIRIFDISVEEIYKFVDLLFIDLLKFRETQKTLSSSIR